LNQLLERNELDALIDLDLKRLKYVLQHSTLQNKDALYLKALNEINEKHPKTEASAEVNYLIVEKKYNALVNEKKITFAH
jgi:hypothetical protein